MCFEVLFSLIINILLAVTIERKSMRKKFDLFVLTKVMRLFTFVH